MSPQWWDTSNRIGIPVVLTKHGVALRILERGRTRQQATRPSWYLSVVDVRTGQQVARFGTDSQVRDAKDALDTARKRIYAILAEEEETT